MRVGLLGYGSIGRKLVRHLVAGDLGNYQVCLVVARTSREVEQGQVSLGNGKWPGGDLTT